MKGWTRLLHFNREDIFTYPNRKMGYLIDDVAHYHKKPRQTPKRNADSMRAIWRCCHNVMRGLKRRNGKKNKEKRIEERGWGDREGGGRGGGERSKLISNTLYNHLERQSKETEKSVWSVRGHSSAAAFNVIKTFQIDFYFISGPIVAACTWKCFSFIILLLLLLLLLLLN